MHVHVNATIHTKHQNHLEYVEFDAIQVVDATRAIIHSLTHSFNAYVWQRSKFPELHSHFICNLSGWHKIAQHNSMILEFKPKSVAFPMNASMFISSTS